MTLTLTSERECWIGSLRGSHCEDVVDDGALGDGRGHRGHPQERTQAVHADEDREQEVEVNANHTLLALFSSLLVQVVQLNFR